jgi:hypothetical protein
MTQRIEHKVDVLAVRAQSYPPLQKFAEAFSESYLNDPLALAKLPKPLQDYVEQVRAVKEKLPKENK